MGLLVERQLTLRGLPNLLIRAVRTSALVTAIVAVSTGFSVLVAQDEIAVKLAEWLAAGVTSAGLPWPGSTSSSSGSPP
jgi:C4-dicarboxylate transporter DctM subunit